MVGSGVVLVVDDEPGIRNFLVKIRGPRCKVINEAADTKEACRKRADSLSILTKNCSLNYLILLPSWIGMSVAQAQ
jgi:hypothetical protein